MSSRGGFARAGAGFPGNPVYHHVNTFMGSKHTGIDSDCRRRSAVDLLSGVLQQLFPTHGSIKMTSIVPPHHRFIFHRRIKADLSSEVAFRVDKSAKTSKLSRLKPVSLT